MKKKVIELKAESVISVEVYDKSGQFDFLKDSQKSRTNFDNI